MQENCLNGEQSELFKKGTQRHNIDHTQFCHCFGSEIQDLLNQADIDIEKLLRNNDQIRIQRIGSQIAQLASSSCLE